MGRVRDELASVIPVLNQNPKAREVVKVLPRTICFDLKGEESKFCVVSTGDQMALQDLVSGEPDVVIYGDADEVAKIVQRKREITHPVAEGKVWVSKGKLSQMILFDRVLNFRPRVTAGKPK